jgi:hypothetical protein
LTDQIKAEVILGQEAEDFVASDLGKVVLGMAKQDFEDACLAFCDVNLTDSAKVAKIQQDARVAKALDRYLSELITRGHEAFGAFKQQQKE